MLEILDDDLISIKMFLKTGCVTIIDWLVQNDIFLSVLSRNNMVMLWLFRSSGSLQKLVNDHMGATFPHYSAGNTDVLKCSAGVAPFRHVNRQVF